MAHLSGSGTFEPGRAWMQQTLRGDPLDRQIEVEGEILLALGWEVCVFDLVTLSQVRSGKTAGGWLLVTQTRLLGYCFCPLLPSSPHQRFAGLRAGHHIE